MPTLPHALALAIVLATGSCGRVNYDPAALTSDLVDAGSGLIDANASLIDGGGACTAAVSGTYVGDGANARVINTGFQPVLVIVQSDAGQEAVFRTATMPTNLSKSFVGGQPMATGMISQASSGFEVGSDSRVNQTGQNYHWVAVPISPEIARGSYVGNGSGQAITGLGFRPEWMLVADEADGSAVVRIPDPGAITYRLDNGTGVPDGISTLDPDGFTLGTRPFVNSNGRNFHYLAWRSSPGELATGAYVGDSSADHLITGLGVLPSYMLILGVATPGAMHRFASLPAFFSMTVNAQEPIFDGIMGFVDGGFAVGTLPTVNELGADYYYAAFAGCPAP